MIPEPTGELTPTPTGHDLILTRACRASAADVWASVTEPERTARWFGPWRGEVAAGCTIEVQMALEQSAPWCSMRIEACEAPRRFDVSMEDDAGSWQLELQLVEAGGATELRLVHHLASTEQLGQTGPGWEYYLDMLTAAPACGTAWRPTDVDKAAPRNWV